MSDSDSGSLRPICTFEQLRSRTRLGVLNEVDQQAGGGNGRAGQLTAAALALNREAEAPSNGAVISVQGSAAISAFDSDAAMRTVCTMSSESVRNNSAFDDAH